MLFINMLINVYNSEIVWNDLSWQLGIVWLMGGGYSKYEVVLMWQLLIFIGLIKCVLFDVGFDVDLCIGVIFVVNGQMFDMLWGLGYLNNEGGMSFVVLIFMGIWVWLQLVNNNVFGFFVLSIYKYFLINVVLLYDVMFGNNGSGIYGYKVKVGWDVMMGFGSVNILKLNVFIQSMLDFVC